MPLSPHEEKALAALEQGLRADDPVLAATLAAAPPPGLPRLPLAGRHVVALVAGLLGLVAAGTLLGDRPLVLGAVTTVLVAAWVVGTARSVARSSRPSPPRPRAGGRGRTAPSLLPIGYGALTVGVVLVLAGIAVAPSAGLAVVALVLVFVVAPIAAVWVMTWTDRRKR